jgi:hypothetical protein
MRPVGCCFHIRLLLLGAYYIARQNRISKLRRTRVSRSLSAGGDGRFSTSISIHTKSGLDVRPLSTKEDMCGPSLHLSSSYFFSDAKLLPRC